MAFNIICGTKRDSSVWRYFNYEAVTDKSTYFVITTDGKLWASYCQKIYNDFTKPPET